MHPAKSEVDWSSFASNHLEDFPDQPDNQFSAEVASFSILLASAIKLLTHNSYTHTHPLFSCRFITTHSLSRQWKDLREKQEYVRETSVALPSGNK